MGRKLVVFVFLLALVGISIRLFMAFLPLDTLITLTLYDDAFYYFKVAQNIVAGVGSTFDGVNRTNGYHPLWMLANLIAFALFDSPGQSIRFLLLLCVALDLAAGTTIALIAYVLAKDIRIMPLMAAVWLLNYRVITATFTGLETGLSMLAIGVLFLAFYFAVGHPSSQSTTLFGIASGFAFLSRTDNIILVGLLFALLLIAVRRPHVLLALPIAAGLSAPWIVWNWITFHSIIQTSAIALKGFEIVQLTSTEQFIWNRLHVLLSLFFRTTMRLYAATALPFGKYVVLTLLWLALVLGASAQYLRHLWRKMSTPRRWLVAAMLIWPFAFICVHVFWRWSFRPHYYPSTFVSILTWYSIAMLGLITSPSILKRGIAMVVIPLILVSFVQFVNSGLLQYQLEMKRAADWLNGRCEGRDICPTVGSFNAGILGFFYNGRVVNLDGVVNNEAVKAIYGRYLGAYIQREGIQCLADFNEALRLDHPAWGWDNTPSFVVAYEHEQEYGGQAKRYIIYCFEELK